MLTFLRSTWEKIGFKLEVKTLDYPTFMTVLYYGGTTKNTNYLWGSAMGPDPTFWYVRFISPRLVLGGGNVANY